MRLVAWVELHSVRVCASSKPVSTELVRFQVEILEVGSKSDPTELGWCGFNHETTPVGLDRPSLAATS
jgi:hypothetical protein